METSRVRHDSTAPAAHVVDGGLHQRLRRPVEAGVCLVEQQETRAGQQGSGKLHSPLHAVRGMVRSTTHGPTETDLIEDLGHALGSDPRQARDEREVLEQSQLAPQRRLVAE